MVNERLQGSVNPKFIKKFGKFISIFCLYKARMWRMSNLISTAVSVFPRGPKQVKLQKSITFLFIKKKKKNDK
jgi:hypothetical protein